MALGGTGNWRDPRLLRQQPRQRNLSQRGLLARSKRFQPVHECDVRLPILFREARHGVAKVGWIECRGLVDCAGQEPLAERAERYKPDAELFECRQNLELRFAPPEGVLALHRRDPLDCMGATDRLRTSFRKAEVIDLPLANQL